MSERERESGMRDAEESQSSFEATNNDHGRQEERGSSESAPTARRQGGADGLQESLEEAQRDRGEVF